jgi:hypothetical protein
LLRSVTEYWSVIRLRHRDLWVAQAVWPSRSPWLCLADLCVQDPSPQP